MQIIIIIILFIFTSLVVSASKDSQALGHTPYWSMVFACLTSKTFSDNFEKPRNHRNYSVHHRDALAKGVMGLRGFQL